MHPSEPIVRHSPRLVVAEKLGAVRVNFRYASFQSMTAGHSEKAGRDQYFEGPHETYGFRLHDIHPYWLDLQYQPATLGWTTPDGRIGSMTFDWAVETQDHEIIFGEDKATREYFDDLELAERLDFAEMFLAEHGAKFERRVAGGLPDRMTRGVVRRMYNARRTRFTEELAVRVQRHVEGSGGTAPLGEVLRIIGGHPKLSLDTAWAMMHKRRLSMPIDVPAMPDSPVTIPPPAEKGALRAFLRTFLPNDGDRP